MFKFLKKKKERVHQLLDIDGNLLQEGDEVEAYRYELGKCKVILEGHNFYYESLESGERIHWARMIDAITERQKVKKIEVC